MLQKTNSDVAFCYEHARRNREMAEHAQDKYKQDYLDMEQRWLRLALSYEFGDRLNQFTAHIACTLRS